MMCNQYEIVCVLRTVKVKDYFIRSGKEMKPASVPSSTEPQDGDAAPAAQKGSWWGSKKPAAAAAAVKTWRVVLPLTDYSLKVALVKNSPSDN